MKVDIGNCTSCNEKNSKFVTTCYKCGATLPWADGYTPPAVPAGSARPGPVAPQPVSSSSKTVAVPLPGGWETNTAASNGQASGAGTAKGAVRVKRALPWAGWAVAGLLATCCGVLWTRGKSAAPRVPLPPAPTSVAGSTAKDKARPGVKSTTTAKTPASAAASQKSTVKPGPSFSEVSAYATGQKGAALTQAQKDAYWNSIAGTNVKWTGQLVDARANGELLLKCNPHSPGADVTVLLDGTQAAMITKINKGQQVSIEGTLQKPSGPAYRVENARITG